MFDAQNSPDRVPKFSKSKDHQQTSSALLTDLFHSQTKQIVSAVLALTRQNDIDHSNASAQPFNRPLSPVNEKEQMQLVKNVAITVRDLLQTLDYAPTPIKTMVNIACLLPTFSQIYF